MAVLSQGALGHVNSSSVRLPLTASTLPRRGQSYKMNRQVLQIDAGLFGAGVFLMNFPLVLDQYGRGITNVRKGHVT